MERKQGALPNGHASGPGGAMPNILKRCSDPKCGLYNSKVDQIKTSGGSVAEYTLYPMDRVKILKASKLACFAVTAN